MSALAIWLLRGVQGVHDEVRGWRREGKLVALDVERGRGEEDAVACSEVVGEACLPERIDSESP